MGSFFLHAFVLDHVYYSPQLKKILAPSLHIDVYVMCYLVLPNM
jgi:hypothetical protein